MTNPSSSEETYNDYINGSRFRFLPFDELKKKHVIITDMTENKQILEVKKFFGKGNAGNYIKHGEIRYGRFRGNIVDNILFTHAPMKVIRDMCEPNMYGVPNMLFTYQEFYDHYMDPIPENNNT